MTVPQASLVCAGALLAMALFAATARAADPQAPPVPDPTETGPLAVTDVEYDAGPTIVSDPQGATYPDELQGRLSIPAGAGPFPVILLLHGRHSTCRVLGVEAPGSPCPDTPVTADIRSYQGYEAIAQALASHGYLVMSVNANGVNTYDAAGDKGGQERSQILARSLDLLTAWNTGTGPSGVDRLLVGRVDLSRIGMMGHSRGGGGVSDFVEYNRTRSDGPRYTGLRAVFSLAGTDYNTPTVHGVNYGVLLPTCDGDVYDLQAAFGWDRGRFFDPAEPGARVQFVLRGGNHNYFNTVWTSDDYSGSDPACTPTGTASIRLSPTDERRAGVALIAGFLRRYVGPEPVFDPLMTGAAALPAGGCPAATTSCPALVQTSYLAPAARRRMLVTPRPDGQALTATDGGGRLSERGLSMWAFCDPHADSGADGGNRDPGTSSGCPTNPDRSRARQLSIAWNGPALVRAEPARAERDVRRFAALTLRAGVDFQDTARNPAGRAPDFDVTLLDDRGHRRTARAGDWSDALIPPPGTVDRELTLSGIRIPLRAFRGVDLGHLRAVELQFGAAAPTGAVQLAELGFQ